METDFLAVKQIIRNHPADFQQQIDTIVSGILDSGACPKPAEILSRFCDAWRTADSKGAICIAWLLSDTAIGQGQPAIDAALARALTEPIFINRKDDQYGVEQESRTGSQRTGEAVRSGTESKGRQAGRRIDQASQGEAAPSERTRDSGQEARQAYHPAEDQLNPANLQEWIQGIIFYDGESKSRLADAVRAYRPPDKPPLGEVATLLYEKLKSLPGHIALTTSELLDWLSKEHDREMDEATLRRHLRQLIPYGIQNDRRIGYYIRP